LRKEKEGVMIEGRKNADEDREGWVMKEGRQHTEEKKKKGVEGMEEDH
jgi:hypothetical protein